MKYKLGDIADITRGISYKSADYTSSEDCEGEVFINLKCVSPNGFRYDGIKYYKGKHKQEQSVKEGDLLIACTDLTRNREVIGNSVKIPKIAKDACFSMDLAKIITNPKIVSASFLYYYLKTPYMRGTMIGISDGSTVVHLPMKVLPEIEVDLPDLTTQKKIVRILSALDSKIELNTEQNEALMDTAITIYRRLLNSVDGSWEDGFIGDNKITKIVKSGVSEYPGKKKYVATADVVGTNIKGFELVEFNKRPSRANMTPLENTVWFAKMEGSTKNVLVADFCRELQKNYIFSTGFMGVKCLNDSLFYIWCYINDDDFTNTKDALSTGTLMAGISNKTIQKAKYVLPPEKLLHNFNKIVEPIFEKVYNNERQNKHISEIRDTLLPKLMSGEIDLDEVRL